MARRFLLVFGSCLLLYGAALSLVPFDSGERGCGPPLFEASGTADLFGGGGSGGGVIARHDCPGDGEARLGRGLLLVAAGGIGLYAARRFGDHRGGDRSDTPPQ